MINPITKKKYLDYLRYQENAPGKSLGFLVFIGKDGKCYKTSTGGIKGGREMFEFNMQVKQSLDSQTSLL